MIRAPLLPNPVMYCVVSGCERTATSTCRASSAVRNSSLVIATRSTALYGMPACLSARSSTTPCAWPWENPSFLPRNWLTDVTSDPGAVANWYIGLLEVDRLQFQLGRDDRDRQRGLRAHRGRQRGGQAQHPAARSVGGARSEPERTDAGHRGQEGAAPHGRGNRMLNRGHKLVLS